MNNYADICTSPPLIRPVNFNIVGVDPGSNNVGVSILNIDSKTFSINNIDTILLNLTLTANHTIHENLIYRLSVLQNNIYNLLNFYKPRLVSIENSYININRPAAVVPISQSISTIELTILSFNSLIPIYKYRPSLIKNSVGAKGHAKKDEMTTALNNLTEISSLIQPNNISEHEVDAIAIAYSMLLDLRSNGIIIC